VIANGKAYIANRGGGTVTIIDTSSRMALTDLPVGGEPRFAVATPDEKFVYVSTNFSNPGIIKIRTSDDTPVATIPVGGRNLAVSPDGSKVYVGTQWNSIGVIDVSTDSTTSISVPTAYSIYAVTIESSTGLGFATDEDRDVVYVFDANSDVLMLDGNGNPVEIAVGSTPRAIASLNPAKPLTISPSTATITGYTGDQVTFTASGGVPPYTWSRSGYGGSLSVLNATQAVWDEDYDYCDVTGTATVTVTDSVGSSVTAIINIPDEDC
jgi:YVTN family beta-propeller protein